jgi:hypothetical protein
VVDPVIEYNWAVNSTISAAILSIAKEAVNTDVKYLNCRPNYTIETHNCFFGLAVKIQESLEKELKGRWRVDVGVLGDYEGVVAKYSNHFCFRLANLRFRINQMSYH